MRDWTSPTAAGGGCGGSFPAAVAGDCAAPSAEVPFVGAGWPAKQSKSDACLDLPFIDSLATTQRSALLGAVTSTERELQIPFLFEKDAGPIGHSVMISRR